MGRGTVLWMRETLMNRTYVIGVIGVVLLTSSSESQSPWIVRGTYRVDGTPSVTSPEGATLGLRSDAGATETSMGLATSSLAAVVYRRSRVRLRGEERASKVSGGAGIWIRAEGSALQVADNEQMIRGDSGWVTQTVTIPVPRDAASIA